MVDRALTDYVLLPKRMLGRLLDVKVWRGDGGGMSDHLLLEARLKFGGGWRSAGRMKECLEDERETCSNSSKTHF